MRLYSFINVYLSQIQQGIQTAHLASDLMVEAAGMKDIKAQMVVAWAKHHKTIICLNGGNQASLDELFDFFNDVRNQFPMTNFYEDEQSLNCAMTGVCIVLPERIYDARWNKETEEYIYENDTELYIYSEFGTSAYLFELIKRIKSCRLA